MRIVKMPAVPTAEKNEARRPCLCMEKRSQVSTASADIQHKQCFAITQVFNSCALMLNRVEACPIGSISLLVPVQCTVLWKVSTSCLTVRSFYMR